MYRPTNLQIFDLWKLYIGKSKLCLFCFFDHGSLIWNSTVVKQCLINSLSLSVISVRVVAKFQKFSRFVVVVVVVVVVEIIG